MKRHPRWWWPVGILILSLPNLLWILLDRSVWDWDPAGYGRHSLAMWSALTGDSEEPWAWLMLNFRSEKAPGISWFTQAFALLTPLAGEVTRALLLSSWLAYAGVMAVMAATVRVLYPTRLWPAWLALGFTAAAPQAIALSHRYMTEPLQVLVISAFYLLAAKARDIAPLALAMWLLLLASAGILLKVTTPLYVVLPGLWCVAVLFEAIRRRKRICNGVTWHLILLAVASLGCAMGALAWYTVHFKAITGYVRNVSSGDLSHAYGVVRPFGEKLMWWGSRLYHAHFLPAAGLLFILVWAGFRALPGAGSRGNGSVVVTIRPVLLGIAALQILICLIQFSRHVEEIDRLWAGVLPALALWVAELTYQVRNSRGPVALAGVLALQWGLVHAEAWGAKLPNLLNARTPVQVLDRSGEQLDEIHRLLDAVEYRGETAPRMVGVSVPWLNSNTMNCYASARVYDGKSFVLFSTIGYMQSSPEHARKLLQERNPAYVIALEPSVLRHERDTLVTVGGDVYDYLNTTADYRRVDFPSRSGVVLFQSTLP